MPPVPPFASDIFYSVQNEDYQTEWALLDRIPRREGLRVLMIASSGENALSLLCHPAVADVHAVDINPAQIHLCELRRSAIHALSRDDQLALMGAIAPDDLSTTARERTRLYERVRPALPDLTRRFWDERRERDIAFGIQHVGRNDGIMHDIQHGLRQAGFETLIFPHDETRLDLWCSVYQNLMTPTYIQSAFGLQSTALAGKIAGIAGYLGECHFHAVRAVNAMLNPFVTTVFTNRYADEAGEQGFPLYLQDNRQAALRRSGSTDRLHLHVGNILEVMTQVATSKGAFDLISISNIADWMTESQFADLVQQVKAYLRSDGAFLARTATPNPMIRTVTESLLEVDLEFTTKLQTVERGPWFRAIAAGLMP